MARVHKSRSMSLVSAKALAKAFNGTRFLISGDRHDKRAWNASRNEVRASIPACYHEVFDAGCPAFGANRVAPPEAIEAAREYPAHPGAIRRGVEAPAPTPYDQGKSSRWGIGNCPYAAGTVARSEWIRGNVQAAR